MSDKIPTPRNKRIQDITGLHFGRWCVVQFDRSHNGRARWLCKCDCGGKGLVYGSSLRYGNSQSCGCLQREKASSANITHGGTVGMNYHPLYSMWKGMHERCRYKKHVAWHNYGGRGISVCQRWFDFELFCEDMESSYQTGLMIERVDNDKGYSKENCVWATAKEESRNKRVNRWFTVDGVRKCMADWCVILGGGSTLIIGRLKRGWSEERALTTPVIKRSSMVV